MRSGRSSGPQPGGKIVGDAKTAVKGMMGEVLPEREVGGHTQQGRREGCLSELYFRMSSDWPLLLTFHERGVRRRRPRRGKTAGGRAPRGPQTTRCVGSRGGGDWGSGRGTGGEGGEAGDNIRGECRRRGVWEGAGSGADSASGLLPVKAAAAAPSSPLPAGRATAPHARRSASRLAGGGRAAGRAADPSPTGGRAGGGGAAATFLGLEEEGRRGVLRRPWPGSPWGTCSPAA
jgi:hypothetical protein